MPRKVCELNEVHPLDCPVVAQVRETWADHTWFYSRGYIRYFACSVWMPCEHQLVAEAAHGVPGGYHVHHVDRNPLNNCATNLAVMTSSEHHRLHGQDYRNRVIVTCLVCEKPFELIASRVLKRNVTFCSNECRAIAARKVDRPSHDMLATLISEYRNWSALGRMFGVSDNAVRKWARAYGLL